MKLYFSQGACSLAANIVAKELDLPVSLVRVDLRTKKLSTGEDYVAINKKGYVPALELDDGTLLTEGVAILQYLADQKPDAYLAPANGTMERYRLQEWLTFINSEVHKAYSPLFDKSAPEQTKNTSLERLEKRHNFIAEHLNSRHFLMGDHFTVADAYLFTTMTWAKNFDIDFSNLPSLKAYMERVAALPSVQAAQAAEKTV